MLKSEKNFLEKIADHIPGLKGYREKEDRRTTDKRLRDFICDRLSLLVDVVNTEKAKATNNGNLPILQAFSSLDKKMTLVTDEIRYASYGYSGLFDQLKIREEELDKIYTFDNGMLERVDAIIEKAKSAFDVESVINELNDLHEYFKKRAGMFNNPSE